MGKQRQLKKVLFRAGVGAVLLSTLLVGAISVAVVVKLLPRQVNDRNDTVLLLLVQQLESFLLSHQNELNVVAKIIQADEQGKVSIDPSVRLQWTSDFFESIKLLDTLGIVRIGVGIDSTLLGMDLSGESYFQNALPKGKAAFWSPVSLSISDNKPHVYLSMRVQHQVLVANIALKRVAEYIEALKLNAGVKIALLDREGTYIYHPDIRMVNERAQFPEFLRLKQANQNESSHHLIRIDGKFWEASLRLIPSTGWGVLLLSDPAVTYESVLGLAFAILGLTLVLLLVFSVGSAALFRKLLAPFDRFMTHIQQMSEGQFQQVELGSQFQEFDLLSAQFNLLSERIHERQSQLISLNRRLEAELDENQKSNEAFQALMRTLARATGEDLFKLIAKTLAEWLRAEFVVVGQLSLDGASVRSLGVFSPSESGEDISYPLQGTPCERTLRQVFFHQKQGCIRDFPSDTLLAELGLDSYMGAAIRDTENRNLGVIAILGKVEQNLPVRAPEVLRILADRCASEILRMRQEDALKILNRDLSDMARSLGLKNREMESMLYVTSHDLKAPLVNIVGFSKELELSLEELKQEMQKSNLEMTPQVQNLINADIPNSMGYIQHGVSRMERLLSGLLKLFRIGRTTNDRKPVNIEALIKTLLDEFQYQIREHQVEVHLGEIPICSGDETQLAQLFQNLIGNAIKYRDPKRPLSIRVEGHRVDREIEISVEDTGKGISESEKERVFQLFYRAANSHGIAGEGLGLTIVQRIVDQHSGQIRMESAEGVGTKFTIRLPAEGLKK